jgi:hypothetical protein
MNAPLAVRNDPGEIMESVLIKGDIAKLTPQERSKYYLQVCESIGLNPLTKPFEYITLNGKLTLYARRDCADQLRKINGISIEIVSKTINDGLITVHVRAQDASGRRDEDFGVVNVATLKGEAAANAMLKAVTKAKRRVTLSISGLGFLDETEVDDIPASAKRAPPKPAPLTLASPPAQPEPPPHDPETGELAPAEGEIWDEPHAVLDAGREHAMLGIEALRAWWKTLSKDERDGLSQADRNSLQRAAEAADAEASEVHS